MASATSRSAANARTCLPEESGSRPGPRGRVAPGPDVHRTNADESLLCRGPDLVAVFGLGLGTGLGLGLVMGLVAGLGRGGTAYGRLSMTRALLALRGRLPWPLMAFLEDAHQRGVFRKSGAVYQFRHVRLQDHLAGITPTPDQRQSQTADVGMSEGEG